MILQGSKKLISLLIVICLIFTLLPMNNEVALAVGNEAEEYIEGRSGVMAVSGSAISIDGTYYDDIKAAFDNVADGQTITLHDDVVYEDYKYDIRIERNITFTLDLNGFILAIVHLATHMQFTMEVAAI